MSVSVKVKLAQSRVPPKSGTGEWAIDPLIGAPVLLMSR